MKTLHAIVISMATLLASNHALAHEEHGKSGYGGIVAEGGHYQAELVAKTDSLVIYITEHGKALPTTGGSAKLTLLSGSKKTELTLQPAGENRFETKGNFDLTNAKAVAALNVPGKPPKTLRFTLDNAHANH